MKQFENIDVLTLLDKPVWQLTGREFCALTYYANTFVAGNKPTSNTNIICEGVRALAKNLGCSESKVYELRKARVFDDAIVSHIGRSIVFNVDKARSLANQYINSKRGE